MLKMRFVSYILACIVFFVYALHCLEWKHFSFSASLLNADISSFIATMEMKKIELSAGGKAGTISDVNYVINVLAVSETN